MLLSVDRVNNWPNKTLLIRSKVPVRMDRLSPVPHAFAYEGEGGVCLNTPWIKSECAVFERGLDVRKGHEDDTRY